VVRVPARVDGGEVRRVAVRARERGGDAVGMAGDAAGAARMQGGDVDATCSRSVAAIRYAAAGGDVVRRACERCVTRGLVARVTPAGCARRGRRLTR